MTLFSDRIVTLAFLNAKGFGSEILAVSNITGAWLVLVCFSIFVSLSTGMTTRVSKVFSAGNYTLCGLFFHKAVIINAILLVPSLISVFFAGPIFRLL